MKERSLYLMKIRDRLQYMPAVAILGPRQIGKTTLALQLKADHYFDLENPAHENAFLTPEFVLRDKQGLVVIDEIQRYPQLFPFLRYWIDAHPEQKFLLLGSASQELVNRSSESLAGRISYLEIAGLGWNEISIADEWERLGQRGAYPRSFLAHDDQTSIQWRIDYIRTFLERDIPQLGIRLAASELRRFWTLIANSNAQLLNFAELGRNFGLSEVSTRRYVEVLQSALVVRTLRPWHENIGKRQVKRPKIYIRDSGLAHALLSIQDVRYHPQLGASWEAFVVENVITMLGLHNPLLTHDKFYFWRSHQGEELDLFFELNNRRYGFEVKFNLRPKLTQSMQSCKRILSLDHLFILTPTSEEMDLADNIKVISMRTFQNTVLK